MLRALPEAAALARPAMRRPPEKPLHVPSLVTATTDAPSSRGSYQASSASQSETTAPRRIEGLHSGGGSGLRIPMDTSWKGLAKRAFRTAKMVAREANPSFRRKIANYHGAEKSFLARQTAIEHKPILAQLEICNVCNIACRMCALTIDPQFKATGGSKRMMKFETVEKLADYWPTVSKCYLMGLGEPTLNPDFVRIVEYLKTFDIALSFNTNGLALDEEMARKFVAIGVDNITFSIDGATAKTYNYIRVGSDFDKMMTNVRRLAAIKRETRAKLPNMIFANVLMCDNIREAEALVDLAAEVGCSQVHFEALLWQHDAVYIQDMFHRHKITNAPVDVIAAEFAKAVAAGKRHRVLVSSQYLDNDGNFLPHKLAELDPSYRP
jgi:sulfatase maturation enzyme AslB (radical SAM superfamily)